MDVSWVQREITALGICAVKRRRGECEQTKQKLKNHTHHKRTANRNNLSFLKKKSFHLYRDCVFRLLRKYGDNSQHTPHKREKEAKEFKFNNDEKKEKENNRAKHRNKLGKLSQKITIIVTISIAFNRALRVGELLCVRSCVCAFVCMCAVVVYGRFCAILYTTHF